MQIRPFRPLIPISNKRAETIVVPPYDVLTTSEALEIHSANPNSLLPVSLPLAIHPSNPYQSAAHTLNSLINTSLTRPETPTLFIYSQTISSHSQFGLVALSSIADYTNNKIKKHERTRQTKEQERVTLTNSISAHVGPVFLAYRDVPDIDTIVSKTVQASPTFDLTQQDVRHQVWPVSEQNANILLDLFATKVAATYIADGHHRAASAAQVGMQRRQESANCKEMQDFDWFLSVLFPASQLTILSYNRVVLDLNGRTQDNFLDALGLVGDLKRMKTQPVDMPTKQGMVYVYVDQWYELKLPVSKGCDVVESVDAGTLQNTVLGPLLGIEDPRQSDRIEFVGGVKGMEYLAETVKKGKAAVAFALCAVSADLLMKVADEGQVMPPKSTWFEPKLKSGFFIHTF